MREKTFGPWLRKRREERGISASRMTRELGMAWSHYHSMEKGTYGAPRDYARLKKIARLLQIPVVKVYEQAGALPPDWKKLARQALSESE